MLSIIDRNLERWALLVFYTILVLVMAVEVLRRELFAYSSIWGEEVVRYSFIYLSWIGVAAAIKERAHIRIDILTAFVSDRMKTVVYIFGDVVMLAVAVVALVWSFETVAVSWQFGSVSHGLRLPMVWFLAAVPIGFSLVVVRLLQSIVRDVRSLKDGTPVYEGAKLFD
ncbi:TRAP transporter small permease [Fulvimarina sp. MAC8]|uniref:TRAP transporter small permease n=1 Tax=Fulvimarina sp. MAC8 TaxID=3162874 RepID=UPI0032EC27C8